MPQETQVVKNNVIFKTRQNSIVENIITKNVKFIEQANFIRQ